MLMKKIAISTSLAVALAASSFSANAAIEIVGGKLYVAETGNVTATFLGSDAGYTDVIYFNNAGFNTLMFNGKTTAIGTVFNLGSFARGTELSFRMHVTNTGNSFYTGPASNNFDNVIHAHASLDNNSSAVLGFEDLQGGGDRDYNDIQMRVTNVSNVPAVPEPETWGMMLGGLGLLGFMARRKNAK